jgi:hypothetical protein
MSSVLPESSVSFHIISLFPATIRSVSPHQSLLHYSPHPSMSSITYHFMRFLICCLSSALGSTPWFAIIRDLLPKKQLRPLSFALRENRHSDRRPDRCAGSAIV